MTIKIPSDYFDYLRNFVLKNIDFYEVPSRQIINSWRSEKNKKQFKGKLLYFGCNTWLCKYDWYNINHVCNT